MSSPGDSGKGFTYTGSGTNSQGNHWCSRDYGTGSDSNGPDRGDAYHYSNQNGSYYYSNSDGSTYYNDGKGGAVYTPPGVKK
ncbi:hypothetical protein BO86DRAFT_391683 [Aspergillus japonicus CBS 114.51]|uniref:Uncharacterized protein n=2 Tax=Aspergillus TaxID=5052 RepID=A0A2V5HI04_ASPV1|nr:hypothetical protein BO86DRAFT_391683 [Aspergillus japonicus CBS 114.51]PYI15710.1 hypothetical protein BO99DRAFT_476155 [Aspergillus violaceofuscus CBS 115571]RAH78567.1 hypothetical protein BO86DRAFT_391683 [Aspergillus japonicus CBS 114.51]